MGFLRFGELLYSFIYSGFSLLDSYSCESAKVSDAVLRAMENGVSNPTVNHNNSEWGKVMLPAALARTAAMQCSGIKTPWMN
jgi:hypothetical protein